MTLEELSRLVLCVREIKDEEEEGLSLTFGVFVTGDLLQALMHSERKLVSLNNSAKRQNTGEAQKACWGRMILTDISEVCMPVPQ